MTVYNLFRYNIPIYMLVGIGILGLLVKVIIHGVYQSLMKASENMANSQNNLMKQVKMRFEACYKLQLGVHNVDIFVDKYIYKHKFCGILLYTWENISGQLFIMSLLVPTIAIGLAVFYECGQAAILSTFLVGLLISSLLIIVESFLNLPQKRMILRINMKDYLENMLRVKLEQVYFYPEHLERYQKEYFSMEKSAKEKDEGLQVTEKEKFAESRKEKHSSSYTAATQEITKNNLEDNKGIINKTEEERIEEDIIAEILKEFLY